MGVGALVRSEERGVVDLLRRHAQESLGHLLLEPPARTASARVGSPRARGRATSSTTVPRQPRRKKKWTPVASGAATGAGPDPAATGRRDRAGDNLERIAGAAAKEPAVDGDVVPLRRSTVGQQREGATTRPD